jgi:hypothetical protein
VSEFHGACSRENLALPYFFIPNRWKHYVRYFLRQLAPWNASTNAYLLCISACLARHLPRFSQDADGLLRNAKGKNESNRVYWKLYWLKSHKEHRVLCHFRYQLCRIINEDIKLYLSMVSRKICQISNTQDARPSEISARIRVLEPEFRPPRIFQILVSYFIQYFLSHQCCA